MGFEADLMLILTFGVKVSGVLDAGVAPGVFPVGNKIRLC